MTLHNNYMKIFIIIAAISLSTMAAVFSVTGISSLFSGYALTVGMMMGVLEGSKVVVASFLARYWEKLSVLIRAYFLTAVVILILITSAGIFGYLSDAYQATKGDYQIVEKEITLIDTKIKQYESENNRIQLRVDFLNNSRISQEARLDSLYSRNNIGATRRVESQIQAYDSELKELNSKIKVNTDSIAIYESQKVAKETENLSGDIGPLKYIAGIFDTDMDTVVKFFIFLLIFVFDPLAILLFVSLNIIIKTKESENPMLGMDNVKNSSYIQPGEEIGHNMSDVVTEKEVVSEEPILSEQIKDDDIEEKQIEFKDEPILENQQEETSEDILEEIYRKIENQSGEESPNNVKPRDDSKVNWKSSNYHPN